MDEARMIELIGKVYEAGQDSGDLNEVITRKAEKEYHRLTGLILNEARKQQKTTK